MTWTYAKSMPDVPHEYIVWAKNPAEARMLDAAIKAKVVVEAFRYRGQTAKNRYYYAPDGYKYWSCGTVINRCLHDNTLPGHPAVPRPGDEPPEVIKLSS